MFVDGSLQSVSSEATIQREHFVNRTINAYSLLLICSTQKVRYTKIQSLDVFLDCFCIGGKRGISKCITYISKRFGFSNDVGKFLIGYDLARNSELTRLVGIYKEFPLMK
jgi:hypothetical protein